MAKITLTFESYEKKKLHKALINVDLDEEHEEFRLMMHASDYHCAIWEFLNRIRNELKYGQPKAQRGKALELARELMLECLDDYDVKGHF